MEADSYRIGRYNFGSMKAPVTDSVAKTFLLSGNEIMLRYANSALGHLTWLKRGFGTQSLAQQRWKSPSLSSQPAQEENLPAGGHGG